jgi:hypothetical protein
MNNRFKFRFWHKSKNHYINTEKLVLNDGTYTQVGTKQMNNGTYCSYIVNEYNTSEIIPEQCTGLKDKNGKLIYEGDIIDCKPFYTKRKVIWINKDCRFNISSSIRVYDSGYEQKTELMEVIGNIHENADLPENEE